MNARLRQSVYSVIAKIVALDSDGTDLEDLNI